MSLRPHGAAWLVVAAALLPRAGWIGYQWFAPGRVAGDPGTSAPAAETTAHRGAALTYPDEELHWQLATNLVRHGSLVTDDGRYAARMPAYPLFLAPFAALGSKGVLFARLAQALLGAAAALCAYRFAAQAFGARGGLVSGLLAALDPFGIFFCNLLLTETLFTLLALLFTTCAWGLGTRGPRAAPLFGLALTGALVVLTRPSAAAWLPAVWAVVAWRLVRSDGRAAVWHIGLCPLVLALLLLPWGLRNRQVLGAYAWLSTNGGATLYDAQGPQADGSSNQSFMHELPQLAALGEVARDRELRRLALAQMRADPARVVRLAWVKLMRMWSLRPNVAEHRESAAAWAGAAYTALLLAGAVAGTWAALRRGAVPGRWALLLAWLPVGYFTVVHMVYIGSVRYRLPLLPFLSVAAGSAARGVITGAKQRKFC